MSKFIIKNKIVSFCVIIAIIIFTIFLLTYNKGDEEVTVFTNSTEKTSEIKSEKVETTKETKPTLRSLPSKNTEKITIIAGEEKVSLFVSTNTLFYDALVEAKNKGTLIFSGKNYSGMGFFVTNIGTLHAGDGKDLLYYVNGKEATVGVSSYVLKDGDVLEWKLE
ncbi:MAG: DUF4430 domain-containing protein [Minisyncoccia bacterium]